MVELVNFLTGAGKKTSQISLQSAVPVLLVSLVLFLAFHNIQTTQGKRSVKFNFFVELTMKTGLAFTLPTYPFDAQHALDKGVRLGQPSLNN